jgi:hypothetical protein
VADLPADQPDGDGGVRVQQVGPGVAAEAGVQGRRYLGQPEQPEDQGTPRNCGNWSRNCRAASECRC